MNSVATYIGALADELSRLAGDEGHGLLSYLLSLAAEEARTIDLRVVGSHPSPMCVIH